MRVLWVIKGLGPGGAENLLVATAAAHSVDSLHIECAFVTPEKDHLVARLEQAGVRTHCLSPAGLGVPWPLRLAKLVRSGDWDVVHVHSPLPGSVARLAVRSIRRESRPRLVATEHNGWATHRRLTRALNRFTNRWDGTVFTVSDEVRASVRQRNSQSVVTLLHGIDTAATAGIGGHRDEVRAELGLSSNEFVVGTVANFRRQKDYPNLLGAARHLADRSVPVRFVAVGQGPLEHEVRALSTSLDLDGRVVFTGFREDAVRVMSACDAFVLASQWEGLPVALMEASALGLPIVATDVGGVSEVMHDDVDALLVPPRSSARLAEAIERLVNDPPLRARLSAAALARAPEFDIGRTVAELEASYVSRKRLSAQAVATPAPSKMPRSSQGEELEVRPATQEDRADILSLLRRSLGGDGDDPRFADLFSWKHDTNPFGRSPMWVATDAGKVVAFRTLMRWEFVRGGEVLRTVRAVDTATDPEYQGRGLFRMLTLRALDEMRTDGVDFVFNTPNSQSRPGYMKMGWREIGRLPAAVRFIGPSGAFRAVRSKVPADRWSQDLTVGVPFDEWAGGSGVAGRWPAARHVRELTTKMDTDFLRWRFGVPFLKYRVVDDGRSAIVVRARQRGTALELAVVASFGDRKGPDHLAARAARQAGADYAIRLGHARAAAGFVPLPQGGPILTWRSVNDAGVPPLSNWNLSLGDIELF